MRLARELWQHSRHSQAGLLRLLWSACFLPATPPWLRQSYRRLQLGRSASIPDWIAPAFVARTNLVHLAREASHLQKGFSLSKDSRYRTIFLPHVIKAVMEFDRLATCQGMAFRHPWLDKRLVEFVMAVPTDQTIRGGLRKIVLRNAMQGILPEKVRTRRDKAYPSALFRRGLQKRARARVEGLLNHTRMAEAGWVLEEPLRQHYARYVAGELDTGRPLWRAITLELWLREHF
jgi:asparagine synthase (glutamine-hydrolysing)